VQAYFLKATYIFFIHSRAMSTSAEPAPDQMDVEVRDLDLVSSLDLMLSGQPDRLVAS
jgi:hypothetical protein